MSESNSPESSARELEATRRELLVGSLGVGSLLVVGALAAPAVARATAQQATDPFEQLKGALDRSDFSLLMEMLIEANNAEIAALAGDQGQAAKTRTTLLRNLNRDLERAKDAAGSRQTFDLAKQLADVAVAKFTVVTLGASLVSSAFTSPLSKVKVVIAALKVIAKVDAVKDKAADLSAIAAKLEELRGQLEHAQTHEQRHEIEQKIKEQLEKAREILKKP